MTDAHPLRPVARRWLGPLLLCLAALLPAAHARDSGVQDGGKQRYVVQLADPPLALYDGRALSAPAPNGAGRLSATAGRLGASGKLERRSVEALEYLDHLAARQRAFLDAASLELGRAVEPVHRYVMATNGLALDLTAEEAEALRRAGLARSIDADQVYRLDTFAGPEWIGAGDIWNGVTGHPAAHGEGVVVGVIDSGINWEHPSFMDPSVDHDHVNPLGEQLGLCDDPEVECNDKLIGVYDFVEDNPSTEDVVEENTKGRDNDGHGSHVASIAAGNRVNVLLNSAASVDLSGVAPWANLITYRVCFIGDPPGPDTGGCSGSAILQAIDQAIEDGVDVINYSIGSSPGDPWFSGSISRAFLSARGAGIFIVTSAGNNGPDPGTVGSPANAPWMIAAGNATHNGVFGSIVGNLVGGSTPPPDDIVGASLTGGTGQLPIVHAADYGFPLCGAGDPELEADCDNNLGLSNPWDGQRPFNGEIVVCDRGTYGRVEKGKNVLLAGAGGYILANNSEFAESIVADDHCLPAAHIGYEDGQDLSAWLGSGSGHGGSISGFTIAERNEAADLLSGSSSRGPALPPVEDVLKPNLIAPGSSILAAIEEGQEFGVKSGTSMASPHVAGAGALLKSVHPTWTPSQIASAIETTATAALAKDSDGGAADPHQRGSGRPVLGDAANAALYLDVTTTEFLTANPSAGGEPSQLNLPGLVDSTCQGGCSFVRTVTDQAGGGSWTVTPEGFPAGVSVAVTPSSFTLGNGASRALDIDLELGGGVAIGEWVFGRLRLSASGRPDQYLTVAAYADGGELPDTWSITDDRDAGWTEFTLSGLAEMPDATFRSGGLVPTRRSSEVLVEDPSNSNPYDGGDGVFTIWHELPRGGLWLYAETLESTAVDLDLFVGRDLNGNRRAEESEELCSSTSPDEFERCDLFDLQAGNYWIVVQNWSGTETGGDEATLLSGAVAETADSGLAASGPGMAAAGEAFPVRVSWDNFRGLPGETWLGAVGIGTHRSTPNNIGVIPVRLTRNAIAAPETYPLFDGVDHGLAVAQGGSHDLLFIDVPPGASGLTVSATAADGGQNTGLSLELRRLEFGEAFAPPPFAASPGGAPVVVSDSGNASGPSVSLSGGSLQAGRWYAVLGNTNGAAASVTIRAEVDFAGEPLSIHRGLWEPSSRPGLGQGYEYNWGGTDRALVWYTYDENGQPAWYIAGAPEVDGNIWAAPLYRVTNDGAAQQLAAVGRVSVTVLAEGDQMFSYTLFGRSGSERMQPLSARTCPPEGSFTGLWYRGIDGLGGASVVMNASTQAQIHYLFDGKGLPRWLVAQDLASPAPQNLTLPMLQFNGYCAVCATSEVEFREMGVLERSFQNDEAGSWSLDYEFLAPLGGGAERTDSIVKLTDTLECL